MAEALYRTIAKTLEAFDQGHIEAEDDLSDLDDILQCKGVKLRNTVPLPRLQFGAPLRPSGHAARYLVRDQPRSEQASLRKRPRFAQGSNAKPQASRNRA
jgi:DNA (cytosine-5)-methyltransferase 1